MTVPLTSKQVRLDLREPMALRAFMARNGFAPGQLRPWDSPDHGYTDPLDSDETKADVRSFMALIWQAALDAEHRASAPHPDHKGQAS